jgi:hypothetical protein
LSLKAMTDGVFLFDSLFSAASMGCPGDTMPT